MRLAKNLPVPTRSEDGRYKLFVQTYGCQMNEYDSEKVLQLLEPDSVVVNSLAEAEVVFLNTCSVREKPAHKLRSVLGALEDRKRRFPDLVVGVGGCYAQQEGESLLAFSPAVDFVVGTHNLSVVPRLISDAIEHRRRAVVVDYRDEWEDLPFAFRDLGNIDNNLSAFGAYYSPVRALVPIQRGCNKNCAFCVVPTTRGTELSRAPNEVIREIEAKVRMGAREVMLLGQTVNSYGRDLSPRFRFSDLIRRVSEIDGLERIRFTSPHPQEVKPDFIDLYRDTPKLCPHIHLPLQSGSDRILKLMNRNYRKQRYLEIVARLKEACPEIAISSDFIVGFPTETEAEFCETLNVVEQVCYSFSYSFVYSPRPNTVALEAFSPGDHVAPAISKQRLRRLQSIQERISAEINRDFVGTVVDLLVEKCEKTPRLALRGRTPHNTLVECVDFEEGLFSSIEPGQRLRVLVTKASPHCLQGRPQTGI